MTAAMRQTGESLRDGADEGIARILARQERGDHQALRQLCRHVLHRMHRQIDLAGSERLLDLLGEHALAAEFGQRPVADAVPGGCDGDNLDVTGRQPMGGGEAVAGLARLGKRKRRTAGSNLQAGHLQIC